MDKSSDEFCSPYPQREWLAQLNYLPLESIDNELLAFFDSDKGQNTIADGDSFNLDPFSVIVSVKCVYTNFY